MKCPNCGKAHRAFPRNCYFSLRSDLCHAIITKLASLDNSEQKTRAINAKQKMDEMQRYIDFKGWKYSA
jgi:hypothetical protein